MKPEQYRRTGRTESASPWQRWLALLSVMLLVLVPQVHSVLQHGASPYLHQVAPPASSNVFAKDVPHADGDEALCMLCSVLGSAAHAADYRSARPVEQSGLLPGATGDRLVPARWHFEQFSRPPPADTFRDPAAG